MGGGEWVGGFSPLFQTGDMTLGKFLNLRRPKFLFLYTNVTISYTS